MILQVGDFIAIATLTVKACQALSSSHGAKAEFASIEGTLKALLDAMKKAEAACMEYHTASFSQAFQAGGGRTLLDSIAKGIEEECGKCKVLVSKFSVSFGSYQRTFAKQSTGLINRGHQGCKSLTLQFHKDEIASTEKELKGHLQAVQLLLNCFFSVVLRKDMADQKTLLGAINSSMGTATKAIGDVQDKVSESVSKLEIISKMLPTSLGYCWGPEQPILLLDGLGRKSCLPMMLVQDSKKFREILLIMHRDRPGYQKIQRGKYVISDEDAGGVLIPQAKWNENLRPGMHLGLSFVLRHSGMRDKQECPRCRSMNTTPSYQERQRKCLRCDLTYRIEQGQQVKLYWNDLKVRPKPSPDNKPCPSSKKVKAKANPIGEGPIRKGTLPPEQFEHPYSRVHYERRLHGRTATQSIWRKDDPEFEKFLRNLPLLHRAAAINDISTLDELIEAGADINAPWEVTDSVYRHDRTGWDFTCAPPIHFAAYYNQCEAVLYLLSRGADVDARDAAGTTALHAAAWRGNEKIFQKLLQKNGDSSACDYDGWDVTIYARNQGHDNISRLLLDSLEGNTELLVKKHTTRYAAKAGNEQTILTILKENEAGEDGGSHTRDTLLSEALMGAAEGGHVELVQRLLKIGANPAALDDCGSTALHWAAWGGHTEIENRRYDVHSSLDDEDNTLDRLTLKSAHHETVISTLIDKGGAQLINARNTQGCTPLHWVAGAGSAGMARFILNSQGDPDIRDKDERSALDRARQTGDETLIQLLQRSAASLGF